MLPDQDHRFLIIAKSIGIDEALAAKVRVPLGEATAGRVFLSGEPLVINTPQESERRHPEYDSPFFASLPLMCKALTASDRVMGVLNITEREDERPFTPLELEYIDLVSNTAASVIDDVVTRQARNQSRDSIVVALAKLAEFRDNDTGRHLDRVTKFTLILADELPKLGRFRDIINDRFLFHLQRAVPLHDIGKVAVPDHILLKPGKLTSEETEVMRRHAETGAETIRSILAHNPSTRFLKMAEEIACAHHEWFDGSGYPRGLKGNEIPLAARIVAVADVYDAITTKRPYKRPLPHDHAVAIIRESRGSQFDPAVVDAFLRREHEFAQVAAQFSDNVVAQSRPSQEQESGAHVGWAPLDNRMHSDRPAVSGSLGR